MNIDFGDLNYLAILVAIVVQYVGGALWYMVLADPWMALIGKTREELPGGGRAVRAYIMALVASVLTVFGLAIIIQATGADELLDGLVIGVIVGIGFIASAMAGQYEFEGRPTKLFLINAGYPVVVLAIGGSILGVWQ